MLQEYILSFVPGILELAKESRVSPSFNVGYAVIGGTHFSREVYIIESSGFKEEDEIDPTMGLTVDDIP